MVGSEVLIRDKIAEIVADCFDQHGLDSYGAADRIIALEEVRDAFAALDREESYSSIYDGDG